MRGMLLVMLAGGLGLAQTAGLPEFDVASVKPSPPAGGDLININLGTVNHGVVTLTNTTLSECIRWAYGLVSEGQMSGPDWLRDRSLRVDIEAKAPAGTPVEQLRLMMQRLLAERFRLRLHREQKAVPHFELTVAKGGPKLRAATGELPAQRKIYARGRLSYDRLPILTLAVLLSRQLKETVVNATGLEGVYDVELEWAPEESAAAEPSALPDIYSAIERQLGLRLERKRTPIDVLMIDSAEKVPSAN